MDEMILENLAQVSYGTLDVAAGGGEINPNNFTNTICFFFLKMTLYHILVSVCHVSNTVEPHGENASGKKTPPPQQHRKAVAELGESVTPLNTHAVL